MKLSLLLANTVKVTYASTTTATISYAGGGGGDDGNTRNATITAIPSN